MLRQIEFNTKWTYHKERSFASNYFFWKILLQFKNLIPNRHEMSLRCLSQICIERDISETSQEHLKRGVFFVTSLRHLKKDAFFVTSSRRLR